MSEASDLNAQLAQRLFGWRYDPATGLWLDPTHTWVPAWNIPCSTTDPVATAWVWTWLERQGMPLLAVEYEYGEETITCHLLYARYQPEAPAPPGKKPCAAPPWR